MGIFDTIGDALTSAYDSTIGKVVNTVGDGVSAAGKWVGGALTTGYNTVSNVVERVAGK